MVVIAAAWLRGEPLCAGQSLVVFKHTQASSFFIPCRLKVPTEADDSKQNAKKLWTHDEHEVSFNVLGFL